MITAIVLSHNDEKIIGKTLSSLSWCDEIIVIDDESTDKTPDIARKTGATVHTHPLNDDFAAQRNFGLSKVKGPALTRGESTRGGEWGLFVDSDEIVTEKLADEIRRVTDTSEVYGYFVGRKDVLWGRELTHGETGNVRLLRLAKKDAGKWERPVHEVWNVKGETKTLTHSLLHYPHPDVAQFIDEINRYSTLNAKHFYTQGMRTNIGQIVLYPGLKFFVNYVWRLGFLDGMPGAVAATLMSFHSFLTRAKLYVLQTKI